MTYINTGRKALPREFQLEFELVNTRLQTTLPTQGDFIVEQRSMAISKVLCLSGVARGRQFGIHDYRLVGIVWILENSHRSMESDGDFVEMFACQEDIRDAK
ncbi:hypothetical protein M7I_3643 [Glarea lozoyensis 74030]|uniref:Uncharacterized protein n=1 Tax=Glarea lozoyensis (strain ATCC 74030 / MF5533) TaxID=1104152 RepID=H0EM17_GLAL7|nr:hypothetical protein M7I_3643 [Glarea lozoyensis 74030]